MHTTMGVRARLLAGRRVARDMADKGKNGKKNGSGGQEQPPPSPEKVVRHIRRLSNIERLRAFLELFKKDDRVLVVIVADPDSMASAMAIKRLLSRRVESTTIAHPNKIKRVNNLAMQELLKIPLVPLRQVKKEEFTKFIVVDSQPTHHPALAAFDYHAVIDHHPVTTGWTAPFVDIRPEYGAASSMLAEYLKSAGIKPAVLLATALFYGIKVDTQNFTKKATYADVLCFQALFKRINHYRLSKIETADFTRYELKHFKTALANFVFRKKKIFVHLGRLTNPDIIVVVADFFTHVHEVGWVIVSGQCGEKLVVVFRCDGYKKDAGKLAQKVFGKMGPAGGHRQSARAEIPIKNIEGYSPDTFSTKDLEKLFKKHLKE